MELECQISTDQNVSTLQPPFLHSPIIPLVKRQSDLKVTMDKEKDEHKDDNEIIKGEIVNEEENIEQRKDKQQDEIKEWKKEQENIEEESKEAIKNYEKEERKLQDEEEEKDTNITNEQDETREKEVERFEKEKTEVNNKNLDSDEESVQSLFQNRLEDATAKDQLSTENLLLDPHGKEEKLTEKEDETLYPISTLRPDTHIQLPLDDIERLKPPVMNEELKLSEFQKLDKEEDKTEEEEEYKEEEEEEDKEEEKEEEEEEEEDKEEEKEEEEEDKDKEEEEGEVKEEEEEEEDKEGREEEENKQKIKTRTDNECLEKVNKVKEIVMQEEEDEQSEDFWNVSSTHKPYQYDKKSMEHSESIDKGDSDESVSSSISSISSSSIPPKNYPQVLAGLTGAINTQIRKDRELAKRLYATPCLTDNMREQIQHSPVLLSLLTKYVVKCNIYKI